MVHRFIQFTSAFLLLVALFATPVSAQEVAVPVLRQHVTDQTGTLSADQIATLEASLVALEARKGSQLAVLIVSTTGSEALENYSLAVAEKNKLGRSKTDDGLLLLIAKDDRKARIEVGYGLEGAVPDALASRIIREYLTPKFRHGDFFGGISDSLDALTKLIDGEVLPEPMTSSADSDANDQLISGMVITGFLTFFFASQAARLGINPLFLRRIGAVGLSVVVALLIVGFGISTFVFALIAYVVSGMDPGSFTSGRGGSGSFGGGGWGGGSSGGGGWSGGGGSFGGGGASGGW